jgi:hypothetical protein
VCCALFYILIPTKKTYGVEVFCSRPNSYSGIPVNSLNPYKGRARTKNFNSIAFLR